MPTEFLVGQQGIGWNVIGATNQFANGAAAYFRNGYVAALGGSMSLAHVFWPNLSATTSNSLKVCVYDKVSGQLLAVSGVINKPPSGGPFDVSAPIAGTLSPGQQVFLVTVPDTGFWGGAQNSGSSSFAENQNTAANFPYAAPPLLLPPADSSANGNEQIVWIEGTPAPAQFLCGQNGSNFSTITGITNQFQAGAAAYFRAGYFAPVGGTLVNAHVTWPAGGSPFVKVCVYDALSGNLIAVSQPIAQPTQAPFDAFAPISGFLTPGQRIFLVTVPSDGNYWGGAQNGPNPSNFVDNQNTVANFPYASPPSVLPAADAVAVGAEQVVWLEGFPALISETNVVLTPTIVAPIKLAPATGAVTMTTAPVSVVTKNNPAPAVGTLSLVGAAVRLALQIAVPAGSIALGGVAPTLSVPTARTIPTATGAVALAGNSPVLTTGTPGSISNGQPFKAIGSGFGTKSLSPGRSSLRPVVADNGSDAPVGSISPQYTASQTGPVAGTGNQNNQNQPVGYTASGADIGIPHPFISRIRSGIHYTLANDGNDVIAAKGFACPAAYPFCTRQEFWFRFDPLWKVNPNSDNNWKDLNDNDGPTTFFGGNQGNFMYTNWPANTSNVLNFIRAIGNTNPGTISLAVPQASFPISAGKTLGLFGLPPACAVLNGQFLLINSVSGSNNNFVATVNADLTGAGTFPGFFSLTAVTIGPNAQFTFTSALGTNPIGIGGVVGFESMGGTIAKFNNPNGVTGNVTAVSGVSPNYTATTDLDTTGLTYTGGGSIFCGVAAQPLVATDLQAQYGTDGPGQPSSNPMYQTTDKNGHNGAFWNPAFNPINPTVGWIRRVSEKCWDNTVNGVGYHRVTDMSQGQGVRNVIMNYAGKTSNAAPTQGSICMTEGNYARDRDPVRNARYYCDGYMDCSGAGVTGQCACVYVGDNATYANCLVLVPQPDITAWADGEIDIATFRQGPLKSGTTGFIWVCNEAGAAGTAISGGQFPIGSSSIPTITNTGSLPSAQAGFAYTAGIGITGGTAPYTVSIAYAAPNTGGWLKVIDAVNGVIGGTPTTIETETVFVSVLDAAGRSSYKILSLNVVSAATLFISATGSDSNPGTFAQPWAITSLQQSNANNAKMASKVVAIIGNSAASPTTYDISTFPKNGPTACKVSPPAGTASASTTVIAVNATGVYTPLCVRLLADPAASGYVIADCFGHSSDGSAPNGRYISVKGIWVDGNGNSTGTSGISGFNFCGPSGFGSGVGIVIQDCKSTGWIAANGNANFGCIKFDGTISNALVSNCVLSNCYQTNISKTTHGNGSCVHDYGQFLTTQYCDMSSAHNAIYQKESNAPPQGATVQYNYIHAGLGMGPSFAGFNNADGASPPYAGCTIRNNIIENGSIIYISAEGNAYLSAPMAYYNNTFYSGTGAPSEHSIGPVGVTKSAGASWNITNHDNIVFCDTGTSIDGTWGIGCYGPTSTDKTIWDFNCYFSASGSTIQAGIATQAGSGSVTLRAKAAFIALAGTPDVHSLWAVNPLFVSAISLNGGSAQYKLQATSPCIGTGNGGATMGAWGGTDVNTGKAPAQIGSTLS